MNLHLMWPTGCRPQYMRLSNKHKDIYFVGFRVTNNNKDEIQSQHAWKFVHHTITQVICSLGHAYQTNFFFGKTISASSLKGKQNQNRDIWTRFPYSCSGILLGLIGYNTHSFTLSSSSSPALAVHIPE